MLRICVWRTSGLCFEFDNDIIIMKLMAWCKPCRPWSTLVEIPTRVELQLQFLFCLTCHHLLQWRGKSHSIDSHLKGFTYAECHMKAFRVYFTVGVENDSMIFKIVVLLFFSRTFGQDDPWVCFQCDVMFCASLKIEKQEGNQSTW